MSFGYSAPGQMFLGYHKAAPYTVSEGECRCLLNEPFSEFYRDVISKNPHKEVYWALNALTKSVTHPFLTLFGEDMIKGDMLADKKLNKLTIDILNGNIDSNSLVKKIDHDTAVDLLSQIQNIVLGKIPLKNHNDIKLRGD